MARMYCWRTGVIGIERDIPVGAMFIARGRPERLRRALGAARLAYDNATFLVPGVPEAESDVAALEAVKAFRAQVLKRLATSGRRAAA